MDTPFKFIILTFTLILTLVGSAQTPKSVDYFASIKNTDLSMLLRGDSIFIEGGPEKIGFPEPLGYIGNNYQRFYIHYITVIKSKDNPFQYHVIGKTKVKENICTFKGTITINKAWLFIERDDPRFEQGFVGCDVTFYEDRTKSSSGIIKGNLTTEFYLDKKGKINYDALMFGADGFSNNECKATWKSYKTGQSKKCNWGDFRIPESGDFDIGAGEFSVADQYVKSGWGNYKLAWNNYPDTPEVINARQKENEKWWK